MNITKPLLSVPCCGVLQKDATQPWGTSQNPCASLFPVRVSRWSGCGHKPSPTCEIFGAGLTGVCGCSCCTPVVCRCVATRRCNLCDQLHCWILVNILYSLQPCNDRELLPTRGITYAAQGQARSAYLVQNRKPVYFMKSRIFIIFPATLCSIPGHFFPPCEFDGWRVYRSPM